MIEQTGRTYRAKQYAKSTNLAPGKVGKTMFLVGSALGLMPPQVKAGSGGIVDRPSHLHIIAIDSSAVTGVMRFLRDRLKAPREILQTRIYNMEDDVARTADAKEAHDLTFCNSILQTIYKIRETVEREGGTHAMIVSSLTGASAALKRGIAGPPGSAGVRNRSGEITGKGYMDPTKWDALSQQLIQIRNAAQVDTHHCIWEAHVTVVKKLAIKYEDAGTTEKVALQGDAGKNWHMNTDFTFRLERNFDDRWPGTRVDKVYFDTRPDMEFTAGGRNQDVLPKVCWNMTKMYRKLGLKVGGWRRSKTARDD